MHFKINSKNLDNINRTYTPKDKGDLINTIIEICKKDKEDIVDLNLIDTSKITDMSYVFCNGSIQFQLNGRNIDISAWDVSNIKDFHNAFEDFTNFDCNLEYWDVSNAFDFKSMFMKCKNFKGIGLDKWNMQNATNISHMFNSCDKLEVDISKWNLNKITDADHCRYVFDDNFDKKKRPRINNRNIRI